MRPFGVYCGTSYSHIPCPISILFGSAHGILVCGKNMGHDINVNKEQQRFHVLTCLLLAYLKSEFFLTW